MLHKKFRNNIVLLSKCVFICFIFMFSILQVACKKYNTVDKVTKFEISDYYNRYNFIVPQMIFDDSQGTLSDVGKAFIFGETNINEVIPFYSKSLTKEDVINAFYSIDNVECTEIKIGEKIDNLFISIKNSNSKGGFVLYLDACKPLGEIAKVMSDDSTILSTTVSYCSVDYRNIQFLFPNQFVIDRFNVLNRSVSFDISVDFEEFSNFYKDFGNNDFEIDNINKNIKYYGAHDLVEQNSYVLFEYYELEQSDGTIKNTIECSVQ